MNVENKRDDRKKKIREIAGGILCIAVLLFIVMQIMLPETGIGGMAVSYTHLTLPTILRV